MSKSTTSGADTSSDAGLIAVRRVRDVRETEALAQFRQAMRVREEHAADVARLDHQLRQAAAEQAVVGEVVELRDVLALRMKVSRITHALRHTKAELAAAEHALACSRQRWEAAKTRLAAVEQLLERRAHERRVALDRAVSREADDLAGQAWLRAMTAMPPAPQPPNPPAPRDELPDAVSGAPIPVGPRTADAAWSEAPAAVLDFRRP